MSSENGIRIVELQDAFRDLVVRVSGLPAHRVFWAKSANVPVPPRPYIAMVLLPPEAPLRAADDRHFHAKPYYRLEVLTSTAGTDYEIDIADNTYSYTATGFDNEFAVRDALVAFAAADPNATVTATGTTTASIDIEGDVTGLNLPVIVRPSATDISIVQYRSSRAVQIFRPITHVIEVSIWGRVLKNVPSGMGRIPSATDTAVYTHAKLLGGLLHKTATEPMRALGHIPKLVTSMPDLSAVLRDEFEDTARLDVEVETTLCHTEFGEWTTEAPVNNESPQLP